MYDDSGGWIKAHRKLLESRVFANPELFKVWMWCLFKASYKETWVPVTTGKGETEVRLGPGQFLFGRNAAAKELRMKPTTVYKRIKKLKDAGNLNIKSDRQYSVITINNWETYQADEIEKEQAKEQLSDNQVTTGEQPSDTNKKANNSKNSNNSSRPAFADEPEISSWKFSPVDRSMAEWMWERIDGLKPGQKKPNFDRWANDIRLMREQDQREPERIREVFLWANEDDFWNTNILSPSKLRKKFDELELKMSRDTTRKSQKPIKSLLLE